MSFLEFCGYFLLASVVVPLAFFILQVLLVGLFTVVTMLFKGNKL
jgi:hypothetical protein